MTEIPVGAAGIICKVCGRVADSVTEHRSPGPLTVGIADKIPLGPWRARCYSHGRDRCWTAWKAVSDAAIPPGEMYLNASDG